MNNHSSFCLAGASPDTGNLGVSALCHSALDALDAAGAAEVVVLDHGRGLRPWGPDDSGRQLRVALCGAAHSRNHLRRESLWNIRVSTWLGGLGNPAARALGSANAVLDVSGGDSFTDLYGARRFAAITLTKRAALESGTPLVLLPQTYGPFRSARTRRVAVEIVRRAELAYARDAVSFAALRELLGAAFDPARHRLGVDMAFALRVAEGVDLACPSLEQRSSGAARVPVVGINVSGLIYNARERAAADYELTCDYRRVIKRLVLRFLEESTAQVVLIPHVVTLPGHPESDTAACEDVFTNVPVELRERVAVAPTYRLPTHAKALIARLDWFCGTRMHSTVAALSTAVPAVALAYSGKTSGVFATCDQAHRVADLRALSTEEVVEAAWQGWCQRESDRAKLLQCVPLVREKARSQLRGIVEWLAAKSSREAV